MNKKRIVTVGIVGLLIGLILIGIFGTKLAEANDFLDFGRKYNSGYSHMNAWTEHSNEAKVGLGIGAVVLLISVCMLIGGFCINTQPTNSSDTAERLKKLNTAKEHGLITQEEYDLKRSEIMGTF